MQDLTALEGKTIVELREIAKVLGITPSNMKKKELLDRIIAVARRSHTEDKPEHSESMEQAVNAQPKRGRRPRMSSVKVGGNSPAVEGMSPTAVAVEVAERVPKPAAEVPARQPSEPTAEAHPKRRGRKPKWMIERERERQQALEAGEEVAEDGNADIEVVIEEAAASSEPVKEHGYNDV